MTRSYAATQPKNAAAPWPTIAPTRSQKATSGKGYQPLPWHTMSANPHILAVKSSSLYAPYLGHGGQRGKQARRPPCTEPHRRIGIPIHPVSILALLGSFDRMLVTSKVRRQSELLLSAARQIWHRLWRASRNPRSSSRASSCPRTAYRASSCGNRRRAAAAWLRAVRLPPRCDLLQKLTNIRCRA